MSEESFSFIHWNCPDCHQFGGVQASSLQPEREVLRDIQRRHRAKTYDEGNPCDGDNIHLE